MSLFSLILGLIVGFLAATETDKIKGFALMLKNKAIDSFEGYIGELALKHQAKKEAAAKTEAVTKTESTAKTEDPATKVEDIATKMPGI